MEKTSTQNCRKSIQPRPGYNPKTLDCKDYTPTTHHSMPKATSTRPDYQCKNKFCINKNPNLDLWHKEKVVHIKVYYKRSRGKDVKGKCIESSRNDKVGRIFILLNISWIDERSDEIVLETVRVFQIVYPKVGGIKALLCTIFVQNVRPQTGIKTPETKKYSFLARHMF